MKCAIRELRGMSEVRIHDTNGPSDDIRGSSKVSITITKEDVPRRPIARDLSCPPATGWRARLSLDMEVEQKKSEDERKKAEILKQQEREKENAQKLAVENKERKIIRVRKNSDRRKRLDTINSESEYSVGPLYELLIFSLLFLTQISETSDKSARRKKKEKRRIAAASNNSPPPPKKSVSKNPNPGLKYESYKYFQLEFSNFLKNRFNIASVSDAPMRNSKERKASANEVAKYLDVITPDARAMPGFEGNLAKWDRHR